MIKNDMDYAVLYFDPAIEGTTVTTDIEPVLSKDYANQIQLRVTALQRALGVANMEAMPQGTTINFYAETGDLGAEQPSEGAEIPLTNFKQIKRAPLTLKLHKRARLTTWDAIAASGRVNALNSKDARMVVLTAMEITKRFFSDAITKSATDAGTAADFQGAMANLWAAITIAGDKYGDMTPIVFSNPVDAKSYLAGATIIGQGDMGLRYIENFMGMGRLFLTPNVPAGTLHGTFSKNIRGAYIGRSSEIAGLAGFTYDVTGMIGIKHSDDDLHGAIRTTVMDSVEFFVEDPALVFKSTIGTADAQG